METKYYCENCEWELIDNTYAECPAWICDNCGCDTQSVLAANERQPWAVCRADHY
jgi:hypothetical protein